jgi:asparagine synthase (glutamine-hydrolysing)
MCGIAGLWSADRAASLAPELVRAMTDVLSHRGPDGSGVRVGPGYGLGHRRLSIVDLAGGAQPMDDAGGVGDHGVAGARVVVTFNGEIYNHDELRRELEAGGARFHTRCDTEVLVHGWLAWGRRLPERLRGMFAFALVDLRTHELFCARDRLGKKPLHYAVLEGESAASRRVAFGSEPKALLAHPGVSRRLDHEALAQFLCLRYVPDPRTAFAAIRRLPPGHRLWCRPGDAPSVDAYWRVPEPSRSAGHGSEQRAGEEFLALLDDAVRCRLMSDVPLGAFLSGGIDSQMVVDAMARARGEGAPPPLACTMGFDDPSMDERAIARSAAARAGVELREGVVDPGAMLALDWFDEVFDEPFADASAIPTYHVSRLARQHVTVALSGDGGDESFAGYRRYRFDVLENRVRGLLPRPMWRTLAALYPKLDGLPRAIRFKRTFENLARTPDEAYARSVSATVPEALLGLARGPLAAAVDACDPLQPVRDAYRAAPAGHPLDRAVFADLATWLPGDVLTKVDRASMAVSLEVRCPLLDHGIVEWARGVPAEWKLAGGVTKAFLRKLLVGRLGPESLSRPKQGFHVPLRAWMRGALGDELERALAEGRDFAGGLVDAEVVRDLLQVHRQGRFDHGEILWAVRCLDRFVRRWGT